MLVKGDTLPEPDETFFVNLNTAVNATIAKPQGVGTIRNDEALPSLSINDVTVTEGNSGTVNAAFTVSLSGASSQIVTVNFASSDGTATSPSDYTVASGPLTFAVGETSKTISVLVKGDTLTEPDETFFVNLNTAVNATIAKPQAVGTIRNDDALPSLSINDVTVTEGNSGTVNAVFTVSLSGASSQTVTVNFASSDGTASSPSDYTAASGPLTFAAGETSKTITVPVKGDTLTEPDETFFVNLSTAANATIAKPQGLGTIRNDDALPSLSINDVTVTEGNSGTTNAVFTVSLSGASSQTVTVNFASSDGTATSPSDYAAASGPLTFAAGETSKTITVLLKGDTLTEADETFFVNLSNPANAAILSAQGKGTIRNDDTANAPPTVSIVAPANGAVIPVPANLTITATANDSDGSVVKVEFFQGAAKLGERTASPYSIVWSNVTAGSYSLTDSSHGQFRRHSHFNPGQYHSQFAHEPSANDHDYQSG